MAILLWLVLSCALLIASASAAKKLRGAEDHIKPNILLVLVDDWGWGNVGYHNEDHLKGSTTTAAETVTPVIDGLVANGIKLNRAYTYCYCSPSRASLQTGRLPVHVSFNNDNPLTWNPADEMSGYAGIPRNMTGIAERMREAGYRTHMTGKWDAGMATFEHTPQGKGYESWLGYYHHANDYFSQTLGLQSTGDEDLCAEMNKGNASADHSDLVDLWRQDATTLGGIGAPARDLNGTIYEEEMFLDHSLQVIRNHAEHHSEDPLFLFHSFHVVHTPLEVPADKERAFSSLENPDRRKYAAMVTYADDVLGQLLNELQQHNMWENTLMIVSSDNGGPIYAVPTISAGANNMPLRGGKLSDWEGGIRVNAFVSGGFVPPKMRGVELDAYVHIADYYATILAAAGITDAHDAKAEAAGLPPVDSINMWPLLSGQISVSAGTSEGEGEGGSEQLRQEMHISEKTLISGDYKLISGGFAEFNALTPRPMVHGSVDYVGMDGYWAGYSAKAVVDTAFRFRDCHRGCLFNIKQDPTEAHELSKVMPAKLREMRARLAVLNKDLFMPDRGNQSQLACEMARGEYGGFYGPFVDLPPTSSSSSSSPSFEALALLSSTPASPSDSDSNSDSDSDSATPTASWLLLNVAGVALVAVGALFYKRYHTKRSEGKAAHVDLDTPIIEGYVYKDGALAVCSKGISVL